MWSAQREWTAVGAAMAVGALLRLAPWSEVFRDGVVRFLGDGDPWYHVLRAQELARTGRIPWFDERLNAPFGAEIPWPPLFDALLSAFGWIAGGGAASDASIARAATAVPVVLGIATIALVAALSARALGPGVAAVASLCAAAFGAHVFVGLVGRPDQHVAEILLLALLLLLVVDASRAATAPARRRRAVAAGAVLAIAFWTWIGAALFAALLGAIASAWHVVAPREDRARADVHDVVLWTAATAAALLVGSVAWLGPDGALRRGGLAGMSVLPAAICLALAGMAAALRLLAARRLASGRAARAGEVIAVGALGLALLAASAPLRAGVGQGLTALARSNPWYAHIREFQPIVGAGFSPLGAELRSAVNLLGLLPIAAAIGAAVTPSLVRGRADRRFGAFVLLAGFAIFLPLAALRTRFAPYLGVFAAPLAGAAAAWAVERFRLAGWKVAIPATLVALSVAPCGAAALSTTHASPTLDASLHLARVAGEMTRASGSGSATVLGSWTAGHHIRYGSGLGVVMSPFGSEGGRGALEDGFAWYLSRSESDAAAVESRRATRWVVLADPIPEVALGGDVLGIEPAARPARLVRDVREGTGIVLGAAIEDVVSVRLFYADGVQRDGEGLSRYRLVAEVAGPDARPLVKLFEVVPGARLRIAGVEPGTRVVLRLEGAVNGARPFQLRMTGLADAGGTAAFVVPYATGRNGAVHVRSAVAHAGAVATSVAIPERAVASGETITAELTPRPRP